jgi:hypothetical protein
MANKMVNKTDRVIPEQPANGWKPAILMVEELADKKSEKVANKMARAFQQKL